MPETEFEKMTTEQLEHRKEWVAALRSGEYKQGKRRLRNENDTFCCLGVLCDLYAKATGSKWGREPPLGFYSLHGEATLLPNQVQRWAGFGVRSPAVRAESGTVDLAALNDSTTKAFDEIADLIEKQHIEGVVADG